MALRQTWKKFIFVCKPIIAIEKCLQIHIVSKHVKVHKIAIFSNIFSNKNELFVTNNLDLRALMGKNYKKIVVFTKMPTIFSKIVSKQSLHACYFFLVCTESSHEH